MSKKFLRVETILFAASVAVAAVLVSQGIAKVKSVDEWREPYIICVF